MYRMGSLPAQLRGVLPDLGVAYLLHILWDSISIIKVVDHQMPRRHLSSPDTASAAIASQLQIRYFGGDAVVEILHSVHRVPEFVDHDLSHRLWPRGLYVSF